MELHKEDPPSSSSPPPPLSGAYIRSLVKQLTTSKPKETMNTKDPSQNLRKNVKNQQQKKQVRRRLHTSKPYQEKLLNMAEARKEIVTALKFHRAAMKQATKEQQQQQQQRRQQEQESLVASLYHPSSHFSSFEQEDVKSNSRRNPRIYPSCTSNFSNDFSYPSLLVPNSYTSFTTPLVVEYENSNFTLPNQTLGLNLNLHDFNNLDSTLLNNNNNNSSSTSSSPPGHLPVVVPGALLDSPTDVQSIIGISQGEVVSSIESSATTQVSGVGYHIAIDDERMEEMRLLGEQYQMELNDTMNLVTSTWWFNFLKNMEHDEIAQQANSQDDALNVFDELIEFPAWLNAEESCLEHWSEDYFQYLNLPW